MDSPWGRKESDTTERLNIFTFNNTEVKMAVYKVELIVQF